MDINKQELGELLFALLDPECVEEQDRQFVQFVAEFVWSMLDSTPDIVSRYFFETVLTSYGVAQFPYGAVQEDSVYDAFPGQGLRVQRALDVLHRGGILGDLAVQPGDDMTQACITHYEFNGEMDELGIADITASRALAGDWRGGDVLYHLLRMTASGRNWKHGRLWVVASAEYWKIATRLSARNIESGLRVLVERGLAEVMGDEIALDDDDVLLHVRPILYIPPGPSLYAE